MPDFLKILKSLLLDGERLLKTETAAQMFEPQLTKKSMEALQAHMGDPKENVGFVGEFPDHILLDWGLDGILTLDDDEGWRHKRTLIWSGMPNLSWVCSAVKDLVDRV